MLKSNWSDRPSIADAASWGLLILLVVAIVFHLGAQQTAAPNTGDAVSNIRSAFSVARGDGFAPRPGGPPTMEREPLPIFALAAQIAVDPRFSYIEDVEQFDTETPANLALKQHNLFWAGLLLLGLIAMMRGFVDGRFVWVVASAGAMGLTLLFFLENPSILDRNYTEIQAGAFLVWTGAAAWAVVRDPKIWRFVVLGLLLGGLSLVKGAFFYVAWAYLVMTPLLMVVGAPRLPLRRAAIGGAAILAGLLVAVGPWAVRNQVHFGTLNISERGGTVLWLRALKNEMNGVELRGAFWVWSPGVVQRWLGPKMGFSAEDLEAGGSLQRLNRSGRAAFGPSDVQADREGRPEDAVSFYSQSRAERTRLWNVYREQGFSTTYPSLADRDLQSNAVKKILANPVGHLRTTPAFFWRSMWSVQSARFNSLIDARMSVLGMAALWVVGLASLVARRPALFGAVAMAVGLVAFYALATHALPRYSQPAIPVMMACIALLGAWTLEAAIRGGVWAWKLASARLALGAAAE